MKTVFLKRLQDRPRFRQVLCPERRAHVRRVLRVASMAAQRAGDDFLGQLLAIHSPAFPAQSGVKYSIALIQRTSGTTDIAPLNSPDKFKEQ